MALGERGFSPQAHSARGGGAMVDGEPSAAALRWNGVTDHVDSSQGHDCDEREPANLLRLEARAGVHARIAAHGGAIAGVTRSLPVQRFHAPKEETRAREGRGDYRGDDGGVGDVGEGIHGYRQWQRTEKGKNADELEFMKLERNMEREGNLRPWWSSVMLRDVITTAVGARNQGI